MSMTWPQFLHHYSHELRDIADGFLSIRNYHMVQGRGPSDSARRKLEEHTKTMKNALQLLQRAGIGEGSDAAGEQKTAQLARVLQEQKIEMIEKDKKFEELQSRLSKEMSAKLRSNNPNVMELSDPMNASKVSVMLMGVYDEEWTRAFDALRTDHKRKEYDTIMKLKSEIMKCFEFCRTQADTQLKTLCRAMFGNEYDKPEEQLSPEVKKYKQMIIENRKALAACSLPHLLEEYRPQAQLTTELEAYAGEERSHLLDYIVKCLETCWYMAVSDPPLFLQDQPHGGEPLDPRMFQPYQTRGNYIDHVVWPAMLVEKDGGIVSKGVAKFTKTKPGTQYPNIHRS